MSTETGTSRKEVLKTIAVDLRKFDFETFDPRKDKMELMTELKAINIKLGGLLRGYK